MHKFLLLISLMLTHPLIASETDIVFKCHLPQSVFDPNFEQGTELYMDITFNVESKEPQITLYGNEGPIIRPFEENTSSAFGFSSDFSSFGSRWNNSYLSMVYLGGKSWGAYLRIETLPQERPNSLTHESEMQCTERIDIMTLK